MRTDYFVVVILQRSSLPHPPFLRSRPHSRHGTKDFSSSSSSLFFLFSNTCYDITKKKRSVKCNCFSQELKTTVFFLFPKDIIKNHKNFPFWDTNKMVGSITAAFVLFSLSRSLCVLRRRVKLVFTLVLVFVSCFRALNGLNGTDRWDEISPQSWYDVDAFKKHTGRRFTRAIQKKNATMRASRVSFFFRNTH